MRNIRIYKPADRSPPFYTFLDGLEGKLYVKLLTQIAVLASTPLSGMKEPHVKHFSIERYSCFYEVREKYKSSSA